MKNQKINRTLSEKLAIVAFVLVLTGVFSYRLGASIVELNYLDRQVSVEYQMMLSQYRWIIKELGGLEKLNDIMMKLGILEDGEVVSTDKLNVILTGVKELSTYYGVDKLSLILDLVVDIKNLQMDTISQLGQVLSFVENQESFNVQLLEKLDTMNISVTNIETTVYEIRNETLVQVNQTVIENATYVYNVADMTVEDLDLDVDLYYRCREYVNNWYVTVSKEN